MWSMGVIGYILFTGCPPFPMNQNDQMILMKIMKGDFSFPKKLWGELSADCKDFIKCLMTMDPEKRYSAEQALEHPFIKNSQSATQLLASVENLKEFNKNRRRWRKAGNAVRMMVKTQMLRRKSSGEEPKNDQTEEKPIEEPIPEDNTPKE